MTVHDNKINYLTVNYVDDFLLSKASHLHVEHLSYRSFITLFGSNFILELYRDILSNKLGFFVFAMDGNNICGFVLGCVNSKLLFKAIKKKKYKYLKMILPQIITNPKTIARLFETLFYVNKENTNVESELIVIITDSNYRAMGIGSQLVSILNNEFLKKGIRQYKVTVHDEMKSSNNFYIKNGMKLTTSFLMYNVKWNLYVNLIN